MIFLGLCSYLFLMGLYDFLVFFFFFFLGLYDFLSLFDFLGLYDLDLNSCVFYF